MTFARLAAVLAVATAAAAPFHPAAGAASVSSAAKPFDANALVRLERVSDPRVAPNGRAVAYTLRTTDYDANKGMQAIWLHDLEAGTTRRLTAGKGSSHSPRWASDGSLYFLSTRSDSQQVWRLSLDGGGEAQAVTALPLDVGAFVLSPTGDRIAISVDSYPDLGADLAASKKRLDARAAQKNSGVLYDKLFVRHWDTWKNGTRAQLFGFALDEQGAATGNAQWLSNGIDGDVPSKPFGGDEEITYTPDGKSVIFGARIAGVSEAWSTNLDLFRVPSDGSAKPENLTADNPATDTGPVVSADGRWLAYRAMKRAGFEADRYAIIVREIGRDGQIGPAREVAPKWDRSADTLQFSPDGRKLYATADDLGQHRVFAIEVATGRAKALTGDGYVEGFALARDALIVAHNTLAGPTQLYKVKLSGSAPLQLTQHNAQTLDTLAFGDYEQFSFKGWNEETVYGHVVKPVGYVAGKKYPIAFIIHGGPQGSMGNHFHYRWNPQTYAGAGFAVVFIDFHGSTGYGQAFTDAISGHWGDRPLEDLQKGYAAALAKYDFLDEKRAAALGASYGGYMINWIAGNWSAPWKALVNHDGVFDNRAMAYSTEELWFDEWEHGGTQFEHPAAYEQFNPVNHVAKWRVPMLVVQGGLDFRVTLDQGISTFTALQRRGVPSQLLHFPDENHWVLKPQNSVQWHEAVTAWIKRWTAEE
ncbi:S9 family peptidase [Nevskia sp.]|uniref:S9 family peptidase n=1 Tax=Nevskia sp. TaxID=1929292 RepID=UPI0025FF8698|nr:S9 family peptidase [Nevskia sp.]